MKKRLFEKNIYQIVLMSLLNIYIYMQYFLNTPEVIKILHLPSTIKKKSFKEHILMKQYNYQSVITIANVIPQTDNYNMIIQVNALTLSRVTSFLLLFDIRKSDSE